MADENPQNTLQSNAQSDSQSDSGASLGVIASIRESLARELEQNWHQNIKPAWPIYWQNMPDAQDQDQDQDQTQDQDQDQDQNHLGFLRFSVMLKSVLPIGLGTRFQNIQGTLEITLGARKGQGMTELDQALDRLIAMFSMRDLKGLRLGAATIKKTFEENGFHLSQLHITFTKIHQRPD